MIVVSCPVFPPVTATCLLCGASDGISSRTCFRPTVSLAMRHEEPSWERVDFWRSLSVMR